MGTVLLIAWLVSAAACAVIAGLTWRRTRPFDEIRYTDWRGNDVALSRWFLWAPLSLIGIAGGVVAFHVLVTHRMISEDMGWGPVAWLAFIVFSGWLLARRVKPRKTPKS